MLLTATTEIDPQQITGFVDKLKGLSFGAIIKIVLLALILLVIIRLLNRIFGKFLGK